MMVSKQLDVDPSFSNNPAFLKLSNLTGLEGWGSTGELWRPLLSFQLSRGHWYQKELSLLDASIPKLHCLRYSWCHRSDLLHLPLLRPGPSRVPPPLSSLSPQYCLCEDSLSDPRHEADWVSPASAQGHSRREEPEPDDIEQDLPPQYEDVVEIWVSLYYIKHCFNLIICHTYSYNLVAYQALWRVIHWIIPDNHSFGSSPSHRQQGQELTRITLPRWSVDRKLCSSR